ncbi:hypothetical protein PPERSA_06263 [Pseudocohnilembus persalinus]|uniref:Uncharacterized protein n=1 Tax=Pseudocohnilembus persalinus TaxID=266149 RepID=A0A0V0QVQ0_PSEPJ|nr:hypothetical protein PPERSA_06263 [Pseudocohnilembus persalinus]|eukprot:KRX06292.1 hypothetical protein PPERSA_06263 [Pseudocohnilembus persalinus]
MGCGTGKLPQFGDPDEDKKQLSYRHSIRIFRFVFDHIDKLFQDNQIEQLIEEVEKTQLMMQQIIIDCYKATQSKEIFYNLADHIKQFISVENKQPLQLVESAYIEEGEQDDEKIKNALLSLEIVDF